jgi:hypothetical protein
MHINEFNQSNNIGTDNSLNINKTEKRFILRETFVSPLSWKWNEGEIYSIGNEYGTL